MSESIALVKYKNNWYKVKNSLKIRFHWFEIILIINGNDYKILKGSESIEKLKIQFFVSNINFDKLPTVEFTDKIGLTELYKDDHGNLYEMVVPQLEDRN